VDVVALVHELGSGEVNRRGDLRVACPHPREQPSNSSAVLVHSARLDTGRRVPEEVRGEFLRRGTERREEGDGDLEAAEAVVQQRPYNPPLEASVAAPVRWAAERLDSPLVQVRFEVVEALNNV
jgi:hypothetical protein